MECGRMRCFIGESNTLRFECTELVEGRGALGDGASLISPLLLEKA